MSKRKAQEQYEKTGEVPAGYVKLPDGKIIPKDRRCWRLTQGKRVSTDPTIADQEALKSTDGTEYLKNPDGSLTRLGGKKLSKADKKFLKRLKRDARKNLPPREDHGRPVRPHRSGGAGVPFAGVDHYPEIKREVDVSARVKDETFTPAPVRCLTPEAQEDREAFERFKRDHGGCTCFISPPCSFCTHPGNPLNQEVDSCWMEVTPQVVPYDPERRMLSHLPSPFGGFVLSGCVGCEHSDRCVNDEAAIRHYCQCATPTTPPMTPEQRAWCVAEIEAQDPSAGVRADATDRELATDVLHAWADYARDKGVL